MTDSPPSHSVLSANEESLQTLVRAIQLSTGQFSLILARCNYRSLRERMMQQLRELSPVPIQTMTLPEGAVQLFTAIKAEVGNNLPSALMVFGLEAINDLDTVLTSANQVREEFRNIFAFPLVLWINDDILQKLIRLAPDLKSWSTTIEFLIATDELTQLIQQTADDVFAKVLDSRENVFLDNAALDLKGGSPHRLELQAAYKQLKTLGTPLEADLEASLEFVLGRVADNSKTDSREHYERSLALWRQTIELETNETTTPTTNPKSKIQNPKSQERLGHTFFYLGLWWRNHAERHLAERPPALEQAKSYFQQALDGFEQTNRPNLAAKYINFLAETLHRLQDWDQLARVANKALTLHKNHSDDFRQARAYGFLAETALAKSDWTEAQQAAQQALSLMKESEDSLSTASPEQSAFLEWERSFHQSWYLFSLAKAQQQLEQPEQALKTLETAKAFAKPHYDPELYIAILGALRESYFQRGDYLTAFEIRQTKREIESQFGYRAFIGAGRLQAKKKVANPALPAAEPAGIVAEEIAASGRQQDVNRLIERMGRDDCKLTVIHGQSGVGKSSMLQAGFIPALTPQAINARNGVVVLQQIYTNWTERLGQRLLEALTGLSNGLALPESANSTTAILEQLRQNVDHNLLTILVFDQFEEFFFIYKDPVQRKPFYDFLRECINTPYVKVILSLREDYLHYLLECNRLESLEIIDNNILDKNILFYLGNFTSQDARSVIQSLTNQTQFLPDEALVNALVKDLTKELGEVRPIELQVVGAQLQTENIATLVQYQEKGPKEALVGRFLEEVVKDCGPENEQIAKLVLYLLTDENHTRPLKTRADLELELDVTAQKLDLVLAILVKSRLIFQIPASPADRYQLVHDYLVAFVRQQQSARLIAEIEKEREQRRLTEARLNKVLKQQLRSARRATFTLAGLLVAIGSLTLLATGISINTYLVNLSLSTDYSGGIDRLVSAIRTAKRLKQFSVGALPEARLAIVTKLNHAVSQTNEINRLEEPTGNVIHVNFSPDNRALATASKEGNLTIWGIDGSLHKNWTAHTERITHISFSPDGKIVTTASEDKTVKLWNLDGKLLRILEGHLDGVTLVSFSPDGKVIATASKDRTVKLWNLDGTEIKTLTDHNDRVISMSFSPDNKLLATASQYDVVRIWSLNGEKVNSINSYRPLAVQFSSDSQTVRIVNKYGSLKLWSLDSKLLIDRDLWETCPGFPRSLKKARISIDGQLITFPDLYGVSLAFTSIYENRCRLRGRSHLDEMSDFSLSSNGEILATTGEDGLVKLWSLRQFKEEASNDSAEVDIVKLSFDGGSVATGSINGVVNLWKKGEVPLKISSADSSVLGFSPNSDTLATASSIYDVEVWSLNRQNHTESQVGFKLNVDNLTKIAFSPKGDMLASTTNDGVISLWESNGNLIKTLEGHADRINQLLFSPNGKFIASIGDDDVKLWRNDGDLIKTLVDSSARRYIQVFFSPDSQAIAVIENRRLVKIWNSGDGKIIETVELKNEDKISNFIFSPDSNFFAATIGGFRVANKEIKIWSVDGVAIKTIKEYNVSNVRFNPDSDIVVSINGDNVIKLWDLDGNFLTDFKEHKGDINDISFSPNSKLVASASEEDSVIRLWDKSGRIVQTLRGHTDVVTSIDFSPDGKTIVSASRDNTIKVWSIEGRELKTLQNHTDGAKMGGIGTVTISPDGEVITGITTSIYNSKRHEYIVMQWGFDGREIRAIRGHSDSVRRFFVDNPVGSFGLGSDDYTIAFSTKEDTVKLWDKESNSLLSNSQLSTEGHDSWVNDVSFSPDGKTIASASDDGTIKLWRREDGSLIKTIQAHKDKVNSVSFSPDGETIASASDDKTIKLWNLEGVPYQTLEGHTDGVRAVSFSPNGKTIASLGGGVVRFWRSRDGKALEQFSAFYGGFNSLYYNSKGNVLIGTRGKGILEFYIRNSIWFKGKAMLAFINPIFGESANQSSEATIFTNDDGMIALDLDLDDLLKRGCASVHDYLNNNPSVNDRDRNLCDNIISEESTLKIQPIGQTLQKVDLTDWFEDAKPNIHR